jgi:CTP synthase (UTP-ammonia lyase)
MTGAETDLDLGHYERFKVQRLVPARLIEAISD